MAKERVPEKKENPGFRYVPQSKDLPATQGILHLVRMELKSEMKAGFSQVNARFNQVDARFEQVLSEIARIGILVEEQNSRNRIVLEGLSGLWERQERVEKRVDHFEKTIHNILRSKA